MNPIVSTLRHFEMNFIKSIFIIIALSFASQIVIAQQFPYLSGLEHTRHIWNPAAIQSEGANKVDLYARQQWFGLGISQAPRYINASLQVPIEDYNMSVGGGLYNNATGPVSSSGLTLNYAYHLDGVLSRYGKLSFGLSGTLNSIAFDATDEHYNDQNDPLLTGGSNSTFFPNLGGGIYYLSSHRKFKDNFFFMGFSAYQAFSSNVLIQTSNFQRELHLFGQIGTNIPFLGGRIEPSLYINYTNPEIVTFTINALYEVEEVFWTGLSYSTVSDILIQGGVTLPGFGNGRNILKIGMVGNLNVGSALTKLGPGLEFYISYEFEK